MIQLQFSSVRLFINYYPNSLLHITHLSRIWLVTLREHRLPTLCFPLEFPLHSDKKTYLDALQILQIKHIENHDMGRYFQCGKHGGAAAEFVFKPAGCLSHYAADGELDTNETFRWDCQSVMSSVCQSPSTNAQAGPLSPIISVSFPPCDGSGLCLPEVGCASQP